MNEFAIALLILEILAAVFLTGLIVLLAKPMEVTVNAVFTPEKDEEEEIAREIVAEDDVAETEIAAAVADDSLSDEPQIIRYTRHFMAKLIQSDDTVKGWYSELKNALLSYKKVKARMSRKHETFRRGRLQYARLAFKGKTLCLYLALGEAELPEKYKVEKNHRTPEWSMFRIKNPRRLKYAKELIELTAQNFRLIAVDKTPVDYMLPYEDTEALIEKGLIRQSQASGFLKK